MKRWHLWLGIGVSALLLWLALRGLRLDEVWQEIYRANYWWLVPGVATYFVALWVRTWRWDYTLRPVKRISARRLFPVVVIGYMGNNVYPFRAGELLRAYVLRRRELVPMSASLATIIVERVFDGLVMLSFVFVALPITAIPDESVGSLVAVASVGFVGVLVVFLAMAAEPERTYRLTEWLGRVFVPSRFRHRLFGSISRFLDGLKSLRSFRSVLVIFVTSVVSWLLETVEYWFVMRAFDFEVSFFALMLMTGVVNLATTLPSAPGYIGTFDAPGIAILVLYGVDEALAGAYTLVLHAALWLPITLLGAVYVLRMGLRWSDFGRAAATRLDD